jgi:hypothetical protein
MEMIRYTDIRTGNDLLDQSLEYYLMYGYEPGGFLTAVLANDLRLAVGRADHWNKERLPEIVNEIIFKMPAISIGSYAAVKEWCKDKNGRRSEYAHYMEKQFTLRALKGEVTT